MVNRKPHPIRMKGSKENGREISGPVDAVRWLCVLALAGLFVYAGAGKLARPEVFLGDVESYRLLPYWAARGVALYLPPLEIVCGLGLLFGGSRRAAAWLLAGLMLVFLVALGAARARGLEIACGCFGGGGGDEATNYLWLVVRDLLILGGLGLVLGLDRERKKETNVPEEDHGGRGALVG